MELVRQFWLEDFSKIKDVEIVKGELFQSNTDISIDSRTIRNNEIFWAIRGENFDGHDFIRDAVDAGAAAVVMQKQNLSEYKDLQKTIIGVNDSLKALHQFARIFRDKFKIPVLAITGTNGKTTTKEMITAILATKYNIHKTEGNLNNQIGVPLTLLKLTSAHEFSVIEMGTNYPGEIRILAEIANPTAGLITNIGRGHLELLGSVEGVAKEKMQLFDYIGNSGTIYLNADDPYLSFSARNIWSYSCKRKKDVHTFGKFHQLNDNGCAVWRLNNKVEIELQIPGIHLLSNAVAASAVALSAGISENVIKEALERYKSYDKRMQTIQIDGILFINDSYNANPDSFYPSLETLKNIAERKNSRKIVIAGDMLELGEHSKKLHSEIIKKFINSDLDAIYVIGQRMSEAAHECGEEVQTFNNHEQLAAVLKDKIRPGDIVLIKGSRGMTMEKILKYFRRDNTA